MSAKYQIIISMCLLNTRKIFLRENVAQVAFRSIISKGIVCNECFYYFEDQNRRDPQATASLI